MQLIETDGQDYAGTEAVFRLARARALALAGGEGAAEAEERRASGAWWTRTRLGAYLPPLSLEALRP